ncbi:inositol monophosphatase [Rhodobacterales bacterium HKCCE3408]|nr:inositol monophosphatase [Rhodobacterales bacterium HKCCE3408]
MIDRTQIDALIEGTRIVAKAEILPRFRNLDAAEIGAKSAPDDLVTVADKAAEVALTELSRAVLPGTEVVGEEAVAENPALLGRVGEAERCVVIDPIDGTLNFVDGIGSFGVILAVVEQGQTVFGLLYDPLGDDWVAAARGQGAWFGRPGLASRALRCRTTPAEQAVGLLGLRLFAPESRGRVLDAYSGFRLIRSLGASCHDYRTLALGRADFAVSVGANPWDHAAGALIVEEAGGSVSVRNGEPYAPTLTKGPVFAVGTPGLMEPVTSAEAAAPDP